jgi:zinc transporter ZupT
MIFLDFILFTDHGHSHSHHSTPVAATDDERERLVPDEEAPSPKEKKPSIRAPPATSPATLGLLVHAATDGIAMGAASKEDSRNLELFIFFALMLHKAPAAFALTSWLQHQGHQRRTVAFYALECCFLSFFFFF